MTPLAQILLRRLQATGPISIADFMGDCLLHPEHGYYTTATPFGTDGDFTTAPEISQMFGEMIGLAIAQSWLDQGSPAPFALVEIGPGRGTLMADILRATARVPGFHRAAKIVLVEASAKLREQQQQTLGTHPTAWVDTINALPDLPLYLVANEFFDALPIRQFTRDNNGWREHMVTAREGALGMGLSAPAPIHALDHRLIDTTPGDIVETCAPAAAIIATIAQQIATHGGAAIVLDYGDWRSLGDTLQALQNHAPQDPLANPGQADITAHVDFQALCTSASAHAAVTPMTRQGVFLERLGITARAQALAKTLSGDALASHISAHRRLTHPAQMGTLFKAIGIHPKTAPPPPGFEP